MKIKAFVLGVMALFAASVSAQVTISTPYTSADTATTLTVVWTTNVPANSSVKYGINNLQYQTPTDPTLVTSHSVTIQLLMAGPIYSVAAVSIDASGNSAQSPTLLAALCGDATEPVAGTVNPFYEGGPYQITWNAPAGTSAITPTVCGQTLNQTVSGVLNDFGSFSDYVGDSYKIRPGPGAWTVHITDKGNLSPISATVPLSQVTQDVSDVMKAQAALAGLTGCIANVLTGQSWPPSCAGSGGGSGPILQTNGVSNFLQTILDLDNGNNLVVTNTSAGHVRFDVTGIPPLVTFQTNTVNNLSQTLLDLDQGTGITITNTSSGHVRFDVTAAPPSLTVQTNSVNNASQTLLNFLNSATITFTNTSGGIETASCTTATNGTIGCLRPDGVTCTVAAGILTCPGGGGGSAVHFEMNDTLLGGQFAASPQILDFHTTSPAAPAGSVNCTWQNDPSTGRVSCYVPLALSPAPFITAPVAGQYVILYPHRFQITRRDFVPGSIVGAADGQNGSGTIVMGNTCSLSYTNIGTWDQYSLADYGISPGAVTAVYGVAISGISSTDQNTFCFPTLADPNWASTSLVSGSANMSLPANQPSATQQTSGLTGFTGAQVATATTVAQMIVTGATRLNTVYNIDSVALVVYYTGTPILIPGRLYVRPPINFDLLTQSIYLDPAFPQWLNSYPLGHEPYAGNFYGKGIIITGTTDCTTAAGVNDEQWCKPQNVSGSVFVWAPFSTGGGGGPFTSAQATAPLRVNGVSGSPQTGVLVFDCPTCSVGTGTNVTINGGSGLGTANFGSLPAAGANGINVTWQVSGSNVSAEILGDGNAAHFLDGTGHYTAPPGSISGMTTGQVALAGSPTSITSSKVLAGSGAGITTGPTTSVIHNCAWFTDTAGTIGDSGSACSGGGGSSATVAWTINGGVPATPASALFVSPVTGTISSCYFVTTASDGASNLVFNIKLAGTNILSGTNATVAAGTATGTVSTFALTSGTIAVTQGNKWEIDITTGTSSWIGVAQCY